MISRHADGTVHFSNLKHMARSPAHFLESCVAATEPTRPMRIGTAVHAILFGSRPGHQVIHAPWHTRTGKAFAEFAAEHPGCELITTPEWEEATAIANAVRTDPVASPFLEGRYEVPLQWMDAGFPCSTGGVDIVGDGWLADLKTTRTAEPEAWAKIIFSMAYHAQMTFYEEGARANMIDTSKGLFLIGVESRPPFAVTVYRLTPATIELGKKSIALWLERLRTCEENNHWPAYAQSVLELEPMPWMMLEEEIEDDD